MSVNGQKATAVATESAGSPERAGVVVPADRSEGAAALAPAEPGEVAAVESAPPEASLVTEEPPAAPARRRRRPLRIALAVLAAVAVAGAAVAAATGVFGGTEDGATASDAASGPAKTAEVKQTSLTRSETLDGTLGYGEATPVQASGQGVVTWLPGEGDTVERGETVYRADEKKVPLLYGATPLYRPLETGAEGRDVELLEKNLSALGYGGFTVDDEYTEGTADAVRDWQEDLDREETGTVQPADAVVASGARRVTDVQAALGAPPNGTVLTWTGTERTITVQLAVKDEDLVSGEETRATVTLPDGSTAEAKVAEVGTAVTAEPAQEGEAQQQSGEDATLPVTLTVEDQKKLGRYQAAPVDVAFEAETREDVLAVPVEALVALREGGYAVEAVRADGTEYLPVKLGMFSGGMVEVSGQGVTAGLKVGVPK